MKNIYLVVSEINGLKAYREIHAAFESLELAETFKNQLGRNPSLRGRFNGSGSGVLGAEYISTTLSIVTVDLIEEGTPEHNEIVLGG